jgi:type I restriction enzyme S subunit
LRSKRLQALTPHGTVRTRIGDIATKYVDPVRVDPQETYTNLGVKWYGEGAFARSPKLGSEIKAKTLYRVKSAQFIYNRMFVTEGSFGLVTPEIANGVVSGEFPAYDLDVSQVIPEWLYLYFQTPSVVNAAAAETRGGTKSRRRWKEDQFEAFEIDLPSLAAQKEIVERVRASSDLVASLKEELALRQLQFAHYRERLLTLQELAA